MNERRNEETDKNFEFFTTYFWKLKKNEKLVIFMDQSLYHFLSIQNDNSGPAFGLPASLSSFKGITRKRDDILRWFALSDCAERFQNFDN